MERDRLSSKPTINGMLANVTGKIESFERSTNDMWRDLTAERFRKIEALVARYHTSIGGALCALSVKMNAWTSQFPNATGGVGPPGRLHHVGHAPGHRASQGTDRRCPDAGSVELTGRAVGQVVFLPGRAGTGSVAPRCQPAPRPRILLAYPGQSKREYLAVFLSSRGYHVIACDNGKEALVHLAGGQFELVVSAVVMPHVDGLELLRALQGGPPVIAVTDGVGAMDGIYRRSATLCGAVAAHSFADSGSALLDSVDWILRGRDDVIRDVVW